MVAWQPQRGAKTDQLAGLAVNEQFGYVRLAAAAMSLSLVLFTSGAAGGGLAPILLGLYAGFIGVWLLIGWKRRAGASASLWPIRDTPGPWMPKPDGTACASVFLLVAGAVALAPLPGLSVLVALGFLGVLASLVLMGWFIMSSYVVLRGLYDAGPFGQRPFIVGAYMFAASSGIAFGAWPGVVRVAPILLVLGAVLLASAALLPRSTGSGRR